MNFQVSLGVLMSSFLYLSIADSKEHICEQRHFDNDSLIMWECKKTDKDYIEICPVDCIWSAPYKKGLKVRCDKRDGKIEWINEKTKCKKRPCGLPIKNGPKHLLPVKETKDCVKDKESSYPAKCKINCEDRYILQGSNEIQCNFENGQWSQGSSTGINTTCIQEKEYCCESLNPEPHMETHHCYEIAKNKFRCTVKCLGNYRLQNENRVLCYSNKATDRFLWEDNNQNHCDLIKKPCLKDPILTEYLKTVSCTNEDGHKSECKLNCEHEFYLEGEQLIKCHFDTGEWGQEYSETILSVCNTYRPCKSCSKTKCPNKKNSKCIKTLEINKCLGKGKLNCNLFKSDITTSCQCVN